MSLQEIFGSRRLYVRNESGTNIKTEFLVIDTNGNIVANLEDKKLQVDIDDARFSEVARLVHFLKGLPESL